MWGPFYAKEIMDTIQIANILLTRRCNLRCDYCSIVRDYSDIPKEYPKMKHYTNSELEPSEWIRILSKLKLNNPDVFIIFYGGEPFLYPGLTELIKYCHSENINYTIISNNTPAIQLKVIDLFNDVGPIHGFTASIDPNLARYWGQGLENRTDIDHSIIKTFEGFRNLKELKDYGIAEDVVAEITVMPDNVKWLYDTVKILSEAGIYSSITTIDMKKSPYYDFSTVDDESLKIPKDDRVAAEFFKILADKSLLVHIPELLLDLYNVLPWEMMCEIYKDLHNVTIDADGNFRLCLRIRGIHTPTVKLDNIFNSDGTIAPFFKSSLKKDYTDHCKGCNWTCMAMSAHFADKIKEHI